MKKPIRGIAHGALIAAMYAALTYLQNALVTGSASMAVQFRVAEALCVLALFTPAAIPGLTVGCFLANLTGTGTLPLDMAVGSMATLLAAGAMWYLRKYPWLAFPMPALLNALLVGWELTVYTTGGFWFNALCVAAGEAAVLYTLGALLYTAMKKRGLEQRIFGEWSR